MEFKKFMRRQIKTLALILLKDLRLSFSILFFSTKALSQSMDQFLPRNCEENFFSAGDNAFCNVMNLNHVLRYTVRKNNIRNLFFKSLYVNEIPNVFWVLPICDTMTFRLYKLNNISLKNISNVKTLRIEVMQKINIKNLVVGMDSLRKITILGHGYKTVTILKGTNYLDTITILSPMKSFHPKIINRTGNRIKIIRMVGTFFADSFVFGKYY